MEKERKSEESKEEVERLRQFVEDIHELSAQLVGKDGALAEGGAEKMHGELERLRNLVYFDELTKVLNRRGFYDRFTRLFEDALYLKIHPESQRSGFRVEGFALVFVDLDNFKSINDTYGHDEGDRVLKEAAQILTSVVRDIDGVARLGGEEFVMILVGAGEDEAFRKSEDVRRLLAERVKRGNSDEGLTGSLGVASLSESDADDLDELVGYADQAMYEAKTKRGKDNTVRWSELNKK